MKKVLVTGALGVIGRNLTQKLKSKNYDVVTTDISVQDYTNYIRADITSFEDLYRIFKKYKIDVVIHMAGEVGRMVGEEHPQKMVYVNNIGTLNIIKLCLENKTKLIYFSTSEVYGHLLDRGTHVLEDEIEKFGSPFITTNVYASSKLFGESLVRHYVTNYDLNAVTIRPFMIYGPGEYPSKYRSAICNFINSGLTGEKIVVHKGAIRSWCYVDDFIDGVCLTIENHPTGRYEAFNIGTDEYYSMEEVARMVIEETGGNYDQITCINPPEKFMSLVKMASIEKIKSLGYSPKVSLRAGIKIVVDWQKKNVHNKTS
ncbi:NAD-dependent epimerase/dehydratase family protein [Methanospirillum sp.]|uniref:NAD-dependent epimerase/dehydratase family protein n=1 Tax=Methanospirillum sp. TaxID=45200 RepID=UPI00359F4DEE